MKHEKVSAEVFYNRETPATVSRQDIRFLQDAAGETERERSRLCTHDSPEELLHEMFIVHGRDAYVRPHLHLNKSESFHLIEGSADLILFREDGSIDRVIPMGDYRSGHPFYYRIAPSCYHALVIRSEVLVFHETTTGPFRREDMVFPPWAPDESDAAQLAAYRSRLAQSMEQALAASNPTAIEQNPEES
jgi:cupin fold WbuC family metalloprotein